MILEEKLPAFYESLMAEPGKLPAAVSLRLEEGNLNASDIPILRAYGLPATAKRIERGFQEAELARMTAELEEMRKQRAAMREHEEANNERVRILSRKGFTGRV